MYEDTRMMWELREKKKGRKGQNAFNALLQWCETKREFIGHVLQLLCDRGNPSPELSIYMVL